MVSKNRIGNHSMNLLTAIANYREDDKTVSFHTLHCLEGRAYHSRMTVPLSLYAIALGGWFVKM
jgi:hypothetical protein